MAKKYKCRVEYLESTGTQWIDTGIAPSNITPIAKMKFIPTQQYSSGNYGIFGCFGANNTRFQVFYNSIGIGTYVSKSWQANTTYEVELNGKVPSATINGSVETSGYSKANGFSSDNMYLFTRNNGDVADNCIPLKLYYCKIWNDSVLVRDFIPVLDNSGKPAMYDQVSGQMFYNQGTGDDFSYGRQIIPVEYLESTGTQYIDTGLKGKNGYDFDYKFNSTRIDSTAYGIGGEWENGKSCYLGLIRDTDYFGYHYQNTSSAVQVQLLTANTDYRVQAHLYSGEQYYVINGTKSAVGTINGSFTSTSNMWLFGIYSSTPLYSYIKVYYCKIWDNGTLIRDFIPCIDENRIPFMFDLVTNTCYLNAGTGQFKVGPNVEKAWGGKKLRRKLALALANLKKKRKYYCEVEYLESSGTQYIDTGYTFNEKTTISFKSSLIYQNSGYPAIYGARTTSNVKDYQIYYNDGNVGGSPTQIKFRNGYSTYTISSSDIGYSGDLLGKEITVKTTLSDITVTGLSSKTISVTYGTNVSPPVSTVLFAQRGNGSSVVTNFGSFKIYYFKIYDNGVLVRDFIPVLDWNYVPCMFDKVTEQLFYNAGTGNFTAGREIHPVDYLESTGVEYVDTGIKFDGANTKIELKTYEDSLTRRHSICGDDGNFFYYFRGTGNWAVGYNGTAANIDLYMSVGDNVFVMDKNNVYVNGVLAKTYTASSSVSAYNALLFNRKTSLVDNGAVTMYYCKIWNNNVLVRDYIPAIDENGVGFMFDRVTHTCFLNQGTGAFKYPAREVEYLISDGNQYIDTGVECTGDLVIQFKGSCSTNVNASACGGLIATPRFRHHWSPYNARFSYWMQADTLDSASIRPEIFSLNTIFEALIDPVNGIATINGGTYTFTPVSSDKTTGKNYGIFARIADDGSIQSRPFTFYYFKMSRNNTLVRDFIPSYKDGVLGMWDKVNEVFYQNAGTGTFTRGKIVEPEYE